MSSIPAWSKDEVRGFLERYGMRGDVIEVVPLEGGCDNLNLLIAVGGRRVVLRRYAHTPEEEIEWELELIRYLGERRFPTPTVLVGDDGRLWRNFLRRPAALFGFVEGSEPSPQSVEDCAKVAAATAELNLLTRDLHLPHARSHTDWKRLERLQATASRVSSPGLAEMAERCRAFGKAFSTRVAEVGGELPRGVIHHDLNPGNALLREGEVVAILDFDEAHEGELVTDVASLLRLWATPQSWRGLREDMTEAIVSSYSRVRPLTEAEWELLPEFLLFFTLADAAEYVSRRVARDPSGEPVRECVAYRRFVEMERERGWVEVVRAARRGSRV